MVRITFLLICIAIPFTQSVNGQSPYRFIMGGPIRIGVFTLAKSVANDLETGVAFQDNKICNVLGEFLFLGIEYDRVGTGIRWMKYSLEGTSSELDQTLDLEYQFLTISIVLFKSIFHHHKTNSRIGLTFGSGQNHYRLSTETSKTLAVKTIDDSFSSSATAVLNELYLTSVIQEGWGYRLGVFKIDANHRVQRNNRRVSGSSENNYYLTVVWQY